MPITELQVEKLIEDYTVSIISLINGLHSEKKGIDRDDLIQEVRIRIWKAYIGNGHNINHFYPYLKKIVNSVFINEINKYNKEIKLIGNYGNSLPSFSKRQNEPGNGDSYTSELKTILNECLTEIKEPQRKVLKLRLSGLSFEEIGLLQQWTYRKTCNLFYRGLNNLKKKLKRRGIIYED